MSDIDDPRWHHCGLDFAANAEGKAVITVVGVNTNTLAVAKALAGRGRVVVIVDECASPGAEGLTELFGDEVMQRRQVAIQVPKVPRFSYKPQYRMTDEQLQYRRLDDRENRRRAEQRARQMLRRAR